MKEYQVSIDGVMHGMSDLYSIKLTRPLFDKFSVGGTCSAQLNLTYTPQATPGKGAKVIVYQRNVGAVTWQQMGVFYIDERTYPYEGQMTLVCYDAMVGIDRPYFEEGDPGVWPRSMPDMVNWIASEMGVAVDSRTRVEAYSMDLVSDKTIRQMLGYIGAANAGNWVVTAENKLLLVPLFTYIPPDAPSVADRLVTENGEVILLGEDGILV